MMVVLLSKIYYLCQKQTHDSDVKPLLDGERYYNDKHDNYDNDDICLIMVAPIEMMMLLPTIYDDNIEDN